MSIRTVVIVILDPRRRTSTEIKYVKTWTIVVIVRLFEQWRRDASENLMRAVDVERLVLNVFVGESGDRFISPHQRFPGATITFALIQILEKIAERSSPKLV